MSYRSPFEAPDAGIPKNLGEIWDLLGSMTLNAPSFQSELFPDQNIETEFVALNRGFELVRTKLGSERFTRLIELADRAKDLFASDPEDVNGNADEGRKLLFEMEGVIQEVRIRRVKTNLND